jgi:hypothetical protein
MHIDPGSTRRVQFGWGVHSSSACSQPEGGSAMARAKKTSKRRRQHTALPIFGAAGASLAMAGGASAAAVPPDQGPSQARAAPYSITVLDEEEISDVSLATFYVLDRESASLGERIQLAQRRCGGGGCRGCGGARRCGGGGCAVARCGGRCAVARCAAVRRCAVVRRCACAGCGCTCSGCSAPCWTFFPTGWVYVC